MYTHPAFQTDRTASLAFAADRGFGLVIACTARTPLASPLPFHLDYSADGTPRVKFHVARANALATLAADGDSWMVAVMGADAYVSPDWYASPDQVPTWLYLSVHLTGPVRPMTDGELARHLDELSEKFEQRLAPKPVWKLDKVAPARRKNLMRAILGIEMRVETVEGSFKLNQHKSDADHIAIAGALAAQNEPAALALSKRMIAMRPHLTYEHAEAAA
ncbi:MAG TPA: FMN-binding negative transcriptional regulator [Xanthobacteraceae bacterium]|nr:FMN-binding negative transcriptional regulator [Xanthobacteraceae bacterium]